MRSYASNRLLCSAAVVALCAASPAVGITPAELSARISHHDNVLVVDVRPAVAFATGHIPDAINVPESLLPYKHLPAAQLVVICGDGLGQVDAGGAQAMAKVNAGVPVDTLAGGYAAWLSATHLTTAPAGVSREQFPAITYDRLVAANDSDVTLVDLTTPTTPATTHPVAALAKTGAAGAQISGGDMIATFAGKLGVPVFKANASSTPHVAAMLAPGRSGTSGTGAASAPAALDTLDGSGRLLVLVADNEADANAAARRLRSRGNYRFTILIGGTNAIRYEGKTGSGRMTGNVADPTQP